MKSQHAIIPQFILTLLLFTASSIFCQEFDEVEIKTQKTADNVYMLMGAGGNIGVFISNDGILLVDDQFAPLTNKIKSAIGKISIKEIRFLVNTHWHPDHVGGNENLGESGTVIIAHENVRTRMNTGQFMNLFQKDVPPAPNIALPIITFTQNITFHLDQEEIQIFHVNQAHTDGDAIVYFKTSNVIHTGDIYFNGLYPFIDIDSLGSVDGMIDAAQHILSVINENTKIIPGHGPLSNKTELITYVNMLMSVRDKLNKALAEGKTLAEIQAQKPTQDFDEKWGHGFLSPEKFVQILYENLSQS